MHAEAAIRQAAIEALEDIKARDIVVLDVRKMTSLGCPAMHGIFALWMNSIG